MKGGRIAVFCVFAHRKKIRLALKGMSFSTLSGASEEMTLDSLAKEATEERVDEKNDWLSGDQTQFKARRNCGSDDQ